MRQGMLCARAAAEQAQQQQVKRCAGKKRKRSRTRYKIDGRRAAGRRGSAIKRREQAERCARAARQTEEARGRRGRRGSASATHDNYPARRV